MAQDVCPAKSEPTLSFTHGLIVGQLSVVLLVAAFIRYFIFGDPPSPEATAAQRAAERRSRTEAHKNGGGGSASGFLSVQPQQQQQQQQQQPFNRRKSGVLRRPSPLTIGSILTKTYYRVDSHQPESLDWFNVLIGQTIAQFRNDAQHDDAILTSLTQALNGASRPDFVDEIRVTELSLGEDFPIFSNCRIIPVDEDGLGAAGGSGGGGGGGGLAGATRLQARMDVDLSDLITLAVETKLLLNVPRRLAAVLPVALAVSVVRFSGTLSVSFVPSHPAQATPTKMIFAFLDDYRLDFSIRSLLGSRSRLQDVPKIAQLIETRLHRWFDERAVEPRFQETRGAGAAPPSEDAAAAAPPPPAVPAATTTTAPATLPFEGRAATAGTSGDTRHSSRPVSRDTRDARDARKEADTEHWVERQQQQPATATAAAAAAAALAAASATAVQAGPQPPPLPSGLRHRRRSRPDDAFSMPGSLPDLSMDPHG
ncbi:mitochondrion biogenesis protein [Niveomyces insectorum RCEF 264]|uniref:Maintenance of mitochondrial morphology protein 1 n=1 Tax=Niveomyces insectorum RCEF 264 TaxID=1081102 RepID=A0A167QQX9_9HYPO|nr:mitochondrion biogenesis protein [Niveomyces insectorum RCEF 264]